MVANKKLMYVFIFILFCVPFNSWSIEPSDINCNDATTWCAASCGLADVQTAVDAALANSAFDVIVYIPAGNCTWINGTKLDVATGTKKDIRVIGSGEGSTKIIHFRIHLPTDGASHIAELAHITMDGNGTSGAMMDMRMRASSPGRTLHWHDFTMKNYNANYNLHFEGWIGLIDHATMYGVNQAGQSHYGITFHGDGQYSDHTGDLGTANAMFVEDSYFKNYGHSISLFCDAFVVFRYNTIDNADTYIDIHGPGYNSCYSGYPGVSSPNDKHAGGGYEVYNNTFTNCEGAWNISPRAGSAGIITNNTVDSGTVVVLQAQETCTNSMNCGTGEGKTINRIYNYGDGSGCLQMLENWWVWNNIGDRELYLYERADCAGSTKQGTHYWNRAPQAGDHVSSWSPYTYPHPLQKIRAPANLRIK